MKIKTKFPKDLISEIDYHCVIYDVTPGEFVKNAVTTYLLLLNQTQKGKKIFLRDEIELELNRGLK